MIKYAWLYKSYGEWKQTSYLWDSEREANKHADMYLRSKSIDCSHIENLTLIEVKIPE